MHFKEILSQNIWPIFQFMLFCPKTTSLTVIEFGQQNSNFLFFFLQLVFHRTDPPVVTDWDVPVVCVRAEVMAQCLDQWDLTTQQVL